MESESDMYTETINFRFPTSLLSATKIKIIQYIELNGKSSRVDIQARTGIPRSVVYENCMKMVEMGLLQRETPHTYPQGRPAILYSLTENINQYRKAKKW